MRLKNPNNAPARGGWWITVGPGSDGKSRRIPQKGSAGSLASLVALVVVARQRMGMPRMERDALAAEIEDTICDRVPMNECWGQGKGDTLHKAIVTGAKAFDAVTGSKFKVERKARGCPACKGRRQQLNKI